MVAIVFLDIDGVLYTRTIDKKLKVSFGPSRQCIRWFRKFLQKVRVKIVIVSSWATTINTIPKHNIFEPNHPLHFLCEHLHEHWFADEAYRKSNHAQTHPEQVNTICNDRAALVLHWLTHVGSGHYLARNGMGFVVEVPAYAIVDDSAHLYRACHCELHERLVSPSHNVGFTFDNYAKCCHLAEVEA